MFNHCWKIDWWSITTYLCFWWRNKSNSLEQWMMWTVLNILNIPGRESIHLNAHRKNIQKCKFSLHYSVFWHKMFSVIALFISLVLEHKALYGWNHVILKTRGYCEFCWQTWGVKSIFCIHQVFCPYWETLKIGKIWLSDWWLRWGEKPCIIVFFSQ